jgi:hypothetical protein
MPRAHFTLPLREVGSHDPVSGNFVDSPGTLPYFTFVDRTLFDIPVSSKQEFSK